MPKPIWVRPEARAIRGTPKSSTFSGINNATNPPPKKPYRTAYPQSAGIPLRKGNAKVEMPPMTEEIAIVWSAPFRSAILPLTGREIVLLIPMTSSSMLPCSSVRLPPAVSPAYFTMCANGAKKPRAATAIQSNVDSITGSRTSCPSQITNFFGPLAAAAPPPPAPPLTGGGGGLKSAAAVSMKQRIQTAQTRSVQRQPTASIIACRTGGKTALLMPEPVKAMPCA